MLNITIVRHAGRQKNNLISLVMGILTIACSLGETRASLSSTTQLEQQPALLDADSITYDQEQHTVTALGNVMLSQGTQFVQADQITFDQTKQQVTAIGHVFILEKGGHLIQAEQVTLTHQLKEGFIGKCRFLLSDNARLVAQKAWREKGDKTRLESTRYTPCNICERDPSRPPIWSIRAKRVEQNGPKQYISHRHAVLEIKGVPVLYTPYFTHADPSIRRKSGFLAPTTSASQNYGFYVRAPYFVDLGPSHDITLSPHIMTTVGNLLGADYRGHVGTGVINVQSSAGHVKRISGTETVPTSLHPILRWHVNGTGRFDLNDHWRLGADIQRASDETYLKNFLFFELEHKNSLDSKLFTEGFYGRHYANATTYAFQGLSTDYKKESIPLILPELNLNLQGDPHSILGGSWFCDANSLSLYRSQGTDVQRLVVQTGWKGSHISPLGDIYTVTASLRGDTYHVHNFNFSDPMYVPTEGPLLNPSAPSGDAPLVNKIIGRAMPQAALDWRYPWYRTFNSHIITLQPIVGFVAAPLIKLNKQIPNEDSRLFDLDDSNLYSQNRFSGLDLLDSGSRMSYGGQVDWHRPHGGHGLFFLGQTYTLKAQADMPHDSGLNQHQSDYVGRLDLMPHPSVDLKYKFRIDQKTTRIHRSDFGLSLGPETLRLKSDYFYFQKTIGTGDTSNREQIRLEIESRPHHQWRGKVHTLRDLTGHGKSLEHGLNVEYRDECLTLTTGVFNTFYHELGVKPNRGVMFRLSLRTLGSLGFETLSPSF